MASGDDIQASSTSTDDIRSWRSIITLVVFVLANIVVLFPFHIPFYIPRVLCDAFVKALTLLRIVPPAQSDPQNGEAQNSFWTRLVLPMNFVTAPLIADLFLLAILAIGRKEVHDGTVGANNISPLDIMAFFISLAYIAISIDASGLIRYLAFKVLQWGGRFGHRLFLYLYAFFFALTAFIGNDPVILSGTAFLAYMTRVSSNILHPRAWIHTQFTVANIASAILVSSNPTNLVLAGAFDIRFINYTANIIVPVIITAIGLFPFLLYIVFADESLIPVSIKMHELPEEARHRAPVNPNIPNARGDMQEQEAEHLNDETGKLLSLEEIMNPFLDKGGAAFGGIIMAATLIALLAVNAASQDSGEHPVFWVTVPAAVIVICWDLGFGWVHREETRVIARQGREEIRNARARKDKEMEEFKSDSTEPMQADKSESPRPASKDQSLQEPLQTQPEDNAIVVEEKHEADSSPPATLASLIADAWLWSQETFPTFTTVLAHLPLALVPFALCMFILVQALVSRGWVQVFAHGWDHWVTKTGTVGAVGGMGFLSVILCNFAGTNIGTSILLSRVIQAWQTIHRETGTPISDRTFWATVYSMALGVNYGAFSAAFSGSLAGLLWRDILARKHIRVSRLDFARVNLPIIAISMTIGCVALIAQVYIMRDTKPYDR